MSQTETRPPGASGHTEELEFTISGMTCGSCAARIDKVLARHAGVAEASVNFATSRATIAFDPDQVSADDLVAAVGKVGYGLSPAEPSSEVDEVDT
ncbi:MAG: cation transporter, partial [Actinobacteria bacterium]|nr:cation transporter [Actinomycetota bacterium]